MRILVSGGCKNGKSTLAQGLAAAQGGRLIYIATMRPHDAEDRARIARHRRERAGFGFETVECPTDIGSLAGALPEGASLLLDSTTALLAEEMFGPGGAQDMDAAPRVVSGLASLLSLHANAVVVSDAIYADALRYDASTEQYRRALAGIDRALAARCDAVIETVYGQCILHKGGMEIAALVEAARARVHDGARALYDSAGLRPLG